MQNLHALAKLRIHTDGTVASLHNEIKRFSVVLRAFKDQTCSAFETKELPSESGRRLRRAGRRKAGDGASATGKGVQTSVKKSFNINTSKLHALGDYVWYLIMYGTTDSYSTAIVGFVSSRDRCLHLTSSFDRARPNTRSLGRIICEPTA